MRKKQFNAHLRTIFTETLLDTSVIRNEISTLHELALIPANQDFNKAFPMTYFYSNVEEPFWSGWGFAGIMSTIEERNNYLMGLPAITNLPPSIANVELSNGLVTAVSANANQVELMVTTSPQNSKFVPFPMYDDGTNGDLVVGDGVYSANLPYYNSGDAVKYYIRAQNNNAMRLSPERAEYEFYIYDPNASIMEEESISYNVYPNPSKDNINITSSSSLPLNCVIYNLSGQKLLAKESSSSSTTIDVSDFKAGIYLLKVNNQIKKIVVE